MLVIQAHDTTTAITAHPWELILDVEGTCAQEAHSFSESSECQARLGKV